jgi:D-alanyl-D-alanine carboxypeptidase
MREGTSGTIPSMATKSARSRAASSAGRRTASALGMLLLLAASMAAGTVFSLPALASQKPRASAAIDSPAVAQLRRFLKAVATGDDDTSFDAVRQIYSSPVLDRSTWPNQRAFLRRLQYHGVERATATDAEITAYDPVADGWAHLVAHVDAQPPHSITLMVVSLGARPKDVAPPPKLEPAQLVAATRARLAELAHKDRFSGAVLIARQGQPLFEEAYGLADLEARTPNRIDTQFRFGSIGKVFTDVAIFQLVEAGKLDLAAPVGRYLKDYPNGDVAAHVTLNDLLTHTGGTGDIFGREFLEHREDLRELKDYVDLYGARAPLFAPGTREMYSNYGYILLGRIIEVTSGLSYEDYLERHVFGPAGMSSTGMLPESVSLPRRAVGYMAVGQDELQSAADTLPYRGTSAGGGYSTVEDLLRFSVALTSDRLLDRAHTRLLESGGITAPDGTHILYDIAGKTLEGHAFLGHSGGAAGMNGELRIFPDDGYTVIVLANLDPPAATVVANFVSDRLR